MGDFLTRHGITIWAENSNFIPYPVLKVEDKPSKVVTVRFGVVESPHAQLRKRIFRIGWSRSTGLQGSYYCTVHASSNQLSAPSPIKSHSPPKIYRWMMPASDKTFSSQAKGEHGWPISVSSTHQDGSNLANISFKVERIQNATEISKLLEALGPGNKRFKKEASVDRLRERGICVFLEQEPYVLFEIFSEVVPSAQVPMSNVLTSMPHGHKPRIGRPHRALELSDESEYRPRKKATKHFEVMSRRSATRPADRTVQSTNRALSITSATEVTRAPSPSSVEALNVQRLKNLAQEHEELNKKILELIDAKEKQNQKLQGVLLEYGR